MKLKMHVSRVERSPGHHVVTLTTGHRVPKVSLVLTTDDSVAVEELGYYNNVDVTFEHFSNTE